jgi:hypothetical protein
MSFSTTQFVQTVQLTETKMPAEFKAKWIAALRSGKYKQTVSRLRDNFGYCCLGVACDISGMGEWDNMFGRWCFFPKEAPKEAALFENDILPASLAIFMGFDDTRSGRNGLIPDLADRHGYPIKLTQLNDDSKLTFDQIADVINYFF